MAKENQAIFITLGATGLIVWTFNHIKKSKDKQGSFSKKHKVVLYHLDYCPFCKLVRDKLDELGIEWTSKDISNKKYKNQLKKKRDGITTVPYIEVNGKGMGESAEIVEMLEQKFGE